MLHLRVTPPSWPRLPRRTARLRLTTLYTGVFLLSGAVLLTITYLLVKHAVGAAPQPAGQAPAAAHPLPEQAKVLQAEAAKQQSLSDLNHLLINSGIALAILALAAVVLGWLMAGRVLRPLATITASARSISASNLHERLAVRGPDDELKDLGDTLNDLFARLEASFQAQRHFVANASHELRTPLTADRTLLQVALDNPSTSTREWRSTGQELLASNTEHERLIEALLTLASSEVGLDHREPVDLSAATDVVLRRPRPVTDRLGLHILAAIQPAALDGDPLLVERLVANLIDNAVRHNVAAGRVEITTDSKCGGAVLTVTNTGPVIPPAEIDRLFQPFQRLDTRRVHHNDGHGLGLSIVRAIANAHDATITARARPDGGLTVDVSFPAPAKPDGAPKTTPPAPRSQAGRAAGVRPPQSIGTPPSVTPGAGPRRATSATSRP
jgi:signal transduction histidine kinase